MKLVESAMIGKARIDKEAGIVRGVKILGYKSGHGYDYSKRSLMEAIPLYENIAVNLNHPPDRRNLGASRRYEERFGRLKNVVFQEDRGLVGDLHYNKNHSIAKQFEYDVETDPKNVGLSHNAKGSTARIGGKLVVQSIDLVRSVDLVADPATNVGLFESRGTGMRVRRKKAGRSNPTARQLVESAVKAARRKPEKKNPTLQLIESIMEGEQDPRKAKIKIMKVLDLNSEESSKPSKKNLVEAKLLEQVSQMKHERRVRDLCEDMGFRPTRVQLKALTSMDSKKEVKQLVESMKSRGNARGGAKSREGVEGRGKKVTTKEFLEDLGAFGLEEDDNEKI
jgi:hypothetical protein